MPSCPCGYVTPDTGPAREGWVCPACGRFLASEEARAVTPSVPGACEHYGYQRKFGLIERFLIGTPRGDTLVLERPRQTLRSLGALALLAGIPVMGITASVVTLGDSVNPLAQTALVVLVLLSLAGGILACLLAMPRGHLALCADPDAQEPLLFLRRGMHPLRCEYQVLSPAGGTVAVIRKSKLSWWIPKPWVVRDAGGGILMQARGVTDSIWTYRAGVIGIVALAFCWLCPLVLWGAYTSSALFTRYVLLDPDGAPLGTMAIEKGGVVLAIRRFSLELAPGRPEPERQLAVVLAGAIALNPSGAR